MKSFRIVSAIYFTDQGQQTIPGIEGTGLYVGAEPNIAALKVYTGINKYLKKYHKMDPARWFHGFDESDPPLILFVLQDLESAKLHAFYSWRTPATQGVRTLTGDKFRERTYMWRNKVRKVPLETVIQ